MKNLSLIVAFIFISCQSKTAQWETLTLDENLSDWHIYQDNGTKSGWKAENDILIFDKISGLESGEDDASLISNKQYTSFEITFDWKIEKGEIVVLCGGGAKTKLTNTHIKLALKFK